MAIRQTPGGFLPLSGGTLTGGLTVALDTITTDLQNLTGTATWNNAAVTFTAIKVNITDTASNAASLLMDLQKAGTSQFKVDKSGNVTALGLVTAVMGSFGTGAASTYNLEVGYNGNVTGAMRVTNAAAGTAALAGVIVQNDGGNGETAQLVKLSSTYTTSGLFAARDTALTNSSAAGKLIIHNGFATGTIVMAAGGSASAHLTIASTGAVTFAGTITVPGTANAMITSSTTFTSGAAAQLGTLTNAPAAGNPTSWIKIVDNGVTRYIPAW